MLSIAKMIMIIKRTFGVRYTNLDAMISKLQTSRNLVTVIAAAANTNERNIRFKTITANIEIIPFPKNGNLAWSTNEKTTRIVLKPIKK